MKTRTNETNNATHTPGPWSIDGTAATDNLDVISPNGRITMLDGDNTEANARLISAAPDLLALLREVHDAIATGDGDFSPSGDWFREAQAVINRATGC